MDRYLDKIQFLSEKNQQIYSHLPAVFFASSANAIILSSLLWHEVPRLPLVAWLIVILLLTVARQATALAYQRSQRKELNAQRWLVIYVVGLFLNGIVWGAAGLIIFPVHSVSHQIFMAFVLGGMVAGSLASSSVLQFGFYIFSLPALIPVSLRFLLMPGDIHKGMGVMIFIFLACCIFIARNLHASAVYLFELRHRNEQEIERRRHSEEALLRHKEELETIIFERTKDLEGINDELRMEIAERQKIERDLKASEDKLRKVLDTLPIGVWFTDAQGEVVYSNPVGEKNWKEARFPGAGEVHGCKARWRSTGEPITPSEWGVARALDNREESHAEEIEVECHDGTHMILHAWALPIINGNGELEGALAVQQDVTEKILLEEKRQKIKKLESVGTLAGGIAHDFNNILAAILGYINLATLDKDLKDKTKKRLAEAEKAIMRAKGLTQRLLTFARGGDPLKEVASLAEVIQSSGHIAFSDNTVTCTYHIPDDLWPVAIDKGQMGQAIHNILINARQAMPEGGEVTIRCENISDGAKAGVPCPPQQRFVKMTIEDKGVGMAPEVVDKVFDPYFSANSQGDGLGLAITQSIIAKHNGHIAVRSAPGEGSAFIIYLPASTLEAGWQEQGKTAEPVIPAQPAKILVMDDEKMILDVAQALLTHLGHDVTVARHGKEAVQLYDKALRSDQPFDLVIMDLTIIGGMGGREAVRAVLEVDPQAKVIVASGYSNDPVMANFTEFGFCAAIVKPFRIEELSRVIAQILA